MKIPYERLAKDFPYSHLCLLEDILKKQDTSSFSERDKEMFEELQQAVVMARGWAHHYNKTDRARHSSFGEGFTDPLEPTKISCALNSEIMKLRFRKQYYPESISVLDYTIIEALKFALEESKDCGGNQ